MAVDGGARGRNLDRGPGVVRNCHVAPRHGAKENRLPDVRVADQDEATVRAGFGCGNRVGCHIVLRLILISPNADYPESLPAPMTNITCQGSWATGQPGESPLSDRYDRLERDLGDAPASPRGRAGHAVPRDRRARLTSTSRSGSRCSSFPACRRGRPDA